MGVAAPDAGVLRVSVVRGSRRVDVAVAAGVPVAELLDELARALRAEPGRCVLATVLGSPLALDDGLGGQGVVEGQVLTLLDLAETSEERHDDMPEAVRSVGSEELSVWRRAHTRGAAAAVAGVTSVVAAITAPAADALFAALVGLAFVAGGTTAVGLVDRRRLTGAWATPALATAAWHVVLLGSGTAVAVDGLPWWSLGVGTARAVTGVGAALVLWGLVLVLVLDRNRDWCVAPLATGALAVLVGMSSVLLDMAPGQVLLAVLTFVLLGQRWLPSLVVDAFLVPDRPGPVDLTQLRPELGAAHRLVVSATLVVVAACVAVAPYAVSSGGWGLVWSVATCLALLLRARHQSLRDHVGVAIAGATAVGLATALAVVTTGATAGGVGAEVVLTVCLGVAAAAVLCLTPWSVIPSGARWGWCGDQIERWSVALLLPAWLLATGIVSSPVGWLG